MDLTCWRSSTHMPSTYTSKTQTFICVAQWRKTFSGKLKILALPCAAGQQSYCPQAGVRLPSVRRPQGVIHKTRILINHQVNQHQIFWASYLSTISVFFSLQNYKSLFFVLFFSVFMNMPLEPYGRTNFKWQLLWKYTTLPNSLPSHSQNAGIMLGRVSTKVTQRIVKLKIWILAGFFFFFFFHLR